MLAECRNIYCSEEQGREFFFYPPLKNDLSLFKFEFQKESINKTGKMYKSMTAKNVDAVQFEMTLSDEFPMNKKKPSDQYVVIYNYWTGDYDRCFSGVF